MDKFNFVAMLLSIGLMGLGAAFVAVFGSDAPASIVGSEGNMRVPDNYRLDYQYLGSWAIAADTAEGQGSKEMHTVYASPGAIEAYRMTGSFADGTVLVKEVSETQTNSMSTGTVSMATNLKGWFVMVKDSANTHVNDPLWGDGWGWSWFDAADPVNTTSTDYTDDCQGCHIPAESTDWIYTRGYPVLNR